LTKNIYFDQKYLYWQDIVRIFNLIDLDRRTSITINNIMLCTFWSVKRSKVGYLIFFSSQPSSMIASTYRSGLFLLYYVYLSFKQLAEPLSFGFILWSTNTFIIWLYVARCLMQYKPPFRFGVIAGMKH
jgi:hypothetical protein